MILFLTLNLFLAVSHARTICSFRHVENEMLSMTKMDISKDFDAFVKEAGSYWVGHKWCDDASTKIKSYLGEMLSIKEAVPNKKKRNVPNPADCIALVSSDATANPYHSYLTPVDSAYRDVTVAHIDTNNDQGYYCAPDPIQSCTVSFSFTRMVSSGTSFSVGSDKSVSISQTFGQTHTNDSTDSNAQSISKMIEASLAIAQSNGTGTTIGTTTGTVLDKTKSITESKTTTSSHEKGYSSTNSSENSTSKATDVKSTTSVSVEAGFNICGVSGKASVSESVEAGVTNTNTGSATNSITNSGSETATSSNETGTTDSISASISNTQNKDSNFHYDVSDTNSNTNSKTDMVNKEHALSMSISSNIDNTNNEMKGVNMDNASSCTYETENTTVITIPSQGVAGDLFYVSQLIPVRLLQIPFLCTANGIQTMYYTDVYSTKGDSSSINKPALALVAKSESAGPYFQLEDADGVEISNVQSTPHIFTALNNGIAPPVSNGYPGDTNTPSIILTSLSGNYVLMLSPLGNMYIQVRDNPGPPIWQTESFVNRHGSKPYTTVTFLINSLGHLNIFASGLFANGKSPFVTNITDSIKGTVREDDRVLIWSTAPKGFKFPIGSNRLLGYRLVLEDLDENSNVDLVLYDGGGSIIWCATGRKCNSPNSKGFLFPADYLWPTELQNPASTYKSSDPHLWVDLSLFKDVTGSNVMNSNEKIVSPNGRFSLTLTEKGNLIMRDYTRIMWESYTSDLRFAKGPYKLILSTAGYTVIDSIGIIIYRVSAVSDGKVLNVQDDGSVLTGYTPLSTFFYRATSREYVINGTVPETVTILYSNGGDFTDTPYMIDYRTTWTGSATVSMAESTLKFNDDIIYTGNALNHSLILNNMGQLAVIETESKIVRWVSHNLTTTPIKASLAGPYTATLSKTGFIIQNADQVALTVHSNGTISNGIVSNGTFVPISPLHTCVSSSTPGMKIFTTDCNAGQPVTSLNGRIIMANGFCFDYSNPSAGQVVFANVCEYAKTFTKTTFLAIGSFFVSNQTGFLTLESSGMNWL